MAFSDRWKANPDGSFTDTKDDSGSSDDDDGGSTRPGSSVPNNLSGGSSSDSDSSSSDDDTDSTAGGGTSSNPAPGLSGGGGVSDTSGGSSGSNDPLSGGSDADLPDAPSVDQDNPFDDSDSGGSSGGSDDPVDATDPTKSTDSGLNTDNDSTPAGFQEPPEGVQQDFENQPSRQSGSGIGPSGVEGSEEAMPEPERDASDNDSTEGIEATKTGDVETSADDPAVREQAQTLEQRLTGTKVMDAVDGLNTTGAEFREEDIQVVRDGDTLRVELSPVGRERVGNIAERQTDEAAERAIERDLNTAFTNQDVSVDNSGNVGVSRDVRNEATEQAIASANPGVRESDVTFQNGEARVQRNRSDPQDRVAEQVANELGISQGEDFTVSRTAPSSRVPTSIGQGDVRVNITQTGAQEIRGRREQAEGDIFTDAVAAVERSPSTAINTGPVQAVLARDDLTPAQKQEIAQEFSARGLEFDVSEEISVDQG